MTAPLAALLRRMSRMAEQDFARHGELDPIWLVETAAGEQHTFISPIVAPNALAAANYKDLLAEKAREMFRDLDVVRYARAMECWAAPYTESDMTDEQVGLHYAALSYTLANHPARREMVLIQAEDETELLQAHREIVRPAPGRAYLGKLSDIERPTKMHGRLVGLLSSSAHAQAAKEASPASDLLPRIRSSSELPDDVGRVFVTNVPDAPLQILGRRDPATGDLCFGSALWPLPGATALEPALAKLSFDVEIVIGPEAERLILAVHRWLTEQANEQNITLEEFICRSDAMARAE
jgi:hypothetical protein